MPANPAACQFEESIARIPGLEPETECPARLFIEMGWLFQLADYMPRHLPQAGGIQEQPALIMDAVEAAMLGMSEWKGPKHGADH